MAEDNAEDQLRRDLRGHSSGSCGQTRSMLKKLIPLLAVAAIILVAALFMTREKTPEACGDIFDRADIEWTKTCEISK
jgi:hypothetical protein